MKPVSTITLLQLKCSACSRIWTVVLGDSKTVECIYCKERYYLEDGEWHNEKLRGLGLCRIPGCAVSYPHSH